jgi:hypothetical protein
LAVLDSVLREELQRLKALRARYASQLAEIPSGSVVMKLKSGHRYAYRAYRKGRKVVTDYVGPEASPGARRAVALLQKRRKIVKEIRAIEADSARLQKMLNAK